MAAEQRTPSKRALWTILVALTSVVLVIAIAAAEFGLRALQERKYGTAATVEQHYRIDPRLNLPVPIANLRSGRIETNSLGFRGPEITVPKKPGTVRVAFLGASTTWCAEVSGNDKAWPHLVAEDLRGVFPSAVIDYVNGGVPGYVARLSLQNLEHRVAPLGPDIVVIYHATNDMSVELRALAAERGLLERARAEPPSWLADRSLLWNLAEKNLHIWLAQRKSEANIGRLTFEPAALGERFRADLTELVLAAQRHARLVAVATFSTQLRAGQSDEQQTRAAASALYYMPFMSPRGLLDAYARYNHIIREVAGATGVLLIEGEDEIPGDAEHFTDSVHFTDTGARAMATRVSKVLVHHAGVRDVLAASSKR